MRQRRARTSSSFALKLRRLAENDAVSDTFDMISLRPEDILIGRELSLISFESNNEAEGHSRISQSDSSVLTGTILVLFVDYEPGGWSLALEILWFNSLYSIYSFNIPFLNLVFSQSCMLWHRITISGVSSFWSRWRHALTTSRNGTKLNDDYIESATGWYHLLDG